MSIFIHAFQITRSSQKVALQIRLPRNTKRIKSIRVTSSGVQFLSRTTNEIGWLWLRIPQQRDVFFAHIIKAEKKEHNSQLPRISNFTFGSGEAWIDGLKEEPFSIEVEEADTILEGFYMDQIRSSFRTPYSVSIYLELEK